MRRPLSPIRLCLLFIVVIFAGIVMILANIDLEYFRSEIDYTLSQSLNRDVRLGKVHFSIKNGLALNCEDVFVSDDSGTRLTIDNLILSLSFQDLLQGKLVWTGLYLVRPDLRLVLPGAEQSEKDKKASAPLLDTLANQKNIRRIEISGGHFLVISHAEENPQNIELDMTELSLRRDKNSDRFNIAFHTRVGQLEITPARVSVEGQISLDENFAWQEVALDLTTKVDNLKIPAIPGTIGTELQLSGKPSSGVKISGNIDSSNIRPDSIPELGTVFSNIQVSTSVLYQPTVLQISDISLNSGPARFSGSIELPLTADDPGLNLQGDLTLQMKEGAQSLARLLPQPSNWSISKGTVSLRRLNFHATLDQLDDPSTLFEQFSGDLQLNGFQLKLPENQSVNTIEGTARLSDGSLVISRLSGSWQNLTLTGSGKVENLGGNPRLELRGNLATEVEKLLENFAVSLPTDMALSGPLQIEALISNSTGNPRISLTTNLNQIQYNGPHGLNKSPETAGSLHLVADLKPVAAITEAALEIGPFSFKANGTYPLSPETPFNIDISSESIRLASIAEFFPPLEPYKLRGETSLNYHIEGDGVAINQRFGRLGLKNAGAHLTSVIGDIQNLNGTVLLSDDGGQTLPLKGQIGSSTAALQCDFKLSPPFEVDIHVQGKSIRSNDLIFPSTKATLQNVDGHVVIDPNGISFKEIGVALEGGTRAVVDGRMDGWTNPEVKLDISSEYGNIDEVISLWTDAPANGRATEQDKKQHTTVAIDIKAEAGAIGPLNFTNASTHLSHDGKGLLRIHPIRFDHKDGFGLAQVLADSRGFGPTRLHISGHVENFPADSIYRDVLQQKSLVTGTMRGDFYLTGLAGESFLETSLGGFAIEIQDGVLRRFKILSKVFSLLNVSQILSFKVPDMAKEGMPFQKMTGTMKLESGLLQGEDLWIHSEAMDMSLVGNYDINTHRIDALLGIKPLKTVDKIITNLPIAGWLLAGEERSLVTAHFQISGEAKDPKVTAVPITSVSRKVFDIFKRVLQLPGKVILAPEEVLIPPAAQPRQ